jgi:hypothetical protein
MKKTSSCLRLHWIDERSTLNTRFLLRASAEKLVIISVTFAAGEHFEIRNNRCSGFEGFRVKGTFFARKRGTPVKRHVEQKA